MGGDMMNPILQKFQLKFIYTCMIDFSYEDVSQSSC